MIDAYRSQFMEEVWCAILPSATGVAAIGKATGRMQPADATTLVGAGMLSVLIFPLAALTLHRHHQKKRAALKD